MKLKDWYAWVKSLPYWKRWFVFLIMIRPIIDPMWEVKIPGIGLSPLEVVGALTPMIIIGLALTNQMPRIRVTQVDRIFMIWCGIIFMNCVFLVLFRPDINTFGVAIKVAVPAYLYYFLRHFVQSEQDLLGILMTMLITAIVPGGMLVYETFVGPISRVQITRGLERYKGLYADMFNYAAYTSMSLMMTGFFILSNKSTLSKTKKKYLIVFVLSLTTLALVKMNHTSSYAVCAGIIGLFFIQNIKQKRIGNVLLLIMILFGASYLVKDTIEKNVSTLVATDLAVLRGEKDIDRAFHGRMWRWKKYHQNFRDLTSIQQLFGASFGHRIIGVQMITGGMHNDYIRIIFLSGILGLIAYLIFLIKILLKARKLNGEYQFLVNGIVLFMLLYAISATPSFYPAVMYITLAIFSYVALPKIRKMIPSVTTYNYNIG